MWSLDAPGQEHPHGAIGTVPRWADVRAPVTLPCWPSLGRPGWASASHHPGWFLFWYCCIFCSIHLDFSHNMALVENVAFLPMPDKQVVTMSTDIVACIVRAASGPAISGVEWSTWDRTCHSFPSIINLSYICHTFSFVLFCFRQTL